MTINRGYFIVKSSFIFGLCYFSDISEKVDVRVFVKLEKLTES